MKKIISNFIYQTIFQVTKIIIPIITIPIVSKSIGPSGLGIYSFTNSIAQFFALFAALGVATYGNRVIALQWKDDKSISKVFWEIVCFKITSGTLVFILYLLMCFFIDNEVYFLVQSLIVLGAVFDISWFFMGIQDFQKTSLINLGVQIISFILILIFINDTGDTLLYTTIQAVGLFVSQIVVWIFLRKYISFVRVDLENVVKHFKGAFEFFIPQIAILLYTNINKTLLGFFLGSVAVGYYTNSLQLNSVFVTIITTIDIVLLPHMSHLFAKNNINKIVETMHTTLHTQLFFSIPIMFGMLTIYDKLVPWFLGEDFLFIINVIPIFSILIVIMPLGISISRQYLMPVGKIKEYNISVIIGAVINIVINFVLLPTIGFYGVVIANISAEFFVTFIRTKAFLKETNFKFDLKKILLFFTIGLLMCILTRILTLNMAETLTTNIIQLVIGSSIYLIGTMVFNINPIFEFIKSKRVRKQ